MRPRERVVYFAPEDVRVLPSTRPEPERGGVLVEVEACAICGTDVKTFFRGNSRITAPTTMGHEFCGTIVQVGAGVTSYQEGQRVTMATTIGCGECDACRAGYTNRCVDLEAIGFHYHGAMAPWVAIPAKAVRQRNLVAVGDLDAELAALSEPLSCVINAVSRPPAGSVRRALVVGLGPLGLMHGPVLRSRGAEVIVGVQSPGVRRDLGGRMGFDRIFGRGEEAMAVKDMTGGQGFDLVAVTAPSAAAQSAAPAYASRGSAVCLFASLPVGDHHLQIDSRVVHYNEISVYGSSDSTRDHVTAAVELLRSDPELFRNLVTHRLPLRGFRDGVTALVERQAVKVVLVPGDD